MKFLPINKTLWVEPIQEETSNLVPEELRDKPPFTACKIIEKSQDCDHQLQFQPITTGTPTFGMFFKKGDTVVVRTEGLEEVKFQGQIFVIVSEKFVVGELKDE